MSLFRTHWNYCASQEPCACDQMQLRQPLRWLSNRWDRFKSNRAYKKRLKNAKLVVTARHVDKNGRAVEMTLIDPSFSMKMENVDGSIPIEFSAQAASLDDMRMTFI